MNYQTVSIQQYNQLLKEKEDYKTAYEQFKEAYEDYKSANDSLYKQASELQNEIVELKKVRITRSVFLQRKEYEEKLNRLQEEYEERLLNEKNRFKKERKLLLEENEEVCNSMRETFQAQLTIAKERAYMRGQQEIGRAHV